MEIEKHLPDVRLPASMEELKSAVREYRHPSEAWRQSAFRRWLGRENDDLDEDELTIGQALLQVEELSALILNYRVRQLSLPPEQQDRSPLTPERLGIERGSLLYHPVRRVLAPVTVITRLEATTTSHALINATDEKYSAGRRLDPKYAHYECRFGYGMLDTKGREFWTTLPNGEPIRVVNDMAPHAAPPWTYKSYEVGKNLRHFREQMERCVAYTFLCDEQKRVIAQHRRLFHPFHELDIDPNPNIEMRLGDGVLKLRSNVFVWGVFLHEQTEGTLSDNTFDLLPGIPYSLDWNERLCGTPIVRRTGNSLLRGRES